MRRILLVLLLIPFSLLAFSLDLTKDNSLFKSDTICKEFTIFYPQMTPQPNAFPKIINSNYPKTSSLNSGIIINNERLSDSSGNLRNIQVPRNPEQVLITKDNQFACIRCFLGNAVQIVNVNTGEIVKSFTIPSPNDFIINHDGTKLIVGSLTDTPMPPDLPLDDCSIFIIPLSGQSILSIIDIATQEIIQSDTLKIWSINKILQPANDSIIYLVGFDVFEFNLNTNNIIRQWHPAHQIFTSRIDCKNNKIFLTVGDSLMTFLKVIDITNGDILTIPSYTNSGELFPFYIGVDTLSNRIFVQGRFQPFSQVLVFDAVSLLPTDTIDKAYLASDCFLPCPTEGSLFIGGDGGGLPNNTLELDYLTLKLKKVLPSSFSNEWKEIIMNDNKTKLFSFRYGGSEGGGSRMNPDQYLDIIEYDIKTSYSTPYVTTEIKYGCSYMRTLAITSDGKKVIATNSPENTISILDLPNEGVSEPIFAKFIKIYPNPTSDLIHITIDKQFDSDFSIDIYNAIGTIMEKILETKSVIDFYIDLSKYPKGQIYLRFSSGNQFYSFKVIKK